ncbi:MAG: DUF6428 family protein [Flavicella sp.]
MKLSEIKKHLLSAEAIAFKLPNGDFVPPHFHITEVGKISKHFIDCGGIERKEEVINFQLWESVDYEHRLSPEKLTKIIDLAQKVIGFDDLEIEVEYQGNTIEKFGIDFQNGFFLLKKTQTACLAEDACGIDVPKKESDVTFQTNNTCTPDSGCC